MTTDVAGYTTLGGSELREMFTAATAWLERHVEAVNAINVFPVPDGDTGTNMLLTMRASVDEAHAAPDASAGGVAEAMAKGALMGARGNSGVILSQILRGFALGLAGKDRADAGDLSVALNAAVESAYRAVTKPAEGTILTVLRETAEAGSADGRVPDVTQLLERWVEAARGSVARTPSLLPILAEAGVVDAGGEGLALILEGSLRYLRGEPVDLPPITADQVEARWITGTPDLHHDEPYGYCTEFLVRGRGLEPAAIRARLEDMGTSVLAVGDAETVHVHVHTQDPGAALSYGTSLGSLSRIKIDNMQEQHDDLVARHERDGTPQAAGRVSTVIVLPSEGLAEVARSMGASVVVRGGQTMNPSTEEILRAIAACPTDAVLVLPNNKNVIMAAEQAARLSRKRATVVPTRTIPEGMAALVALNPDADLERNAETVREAITSVQTAEITRAARSTAVNGFRVEEGRFIGIVNGELTVHEERAEDAVIAALEQMVSPEASLVTLYYGADVTDGQARGLAGDLGDRFPGQEVEVIAGGQPHYAYIVSVE